jgi:hypothetical protein
MKPFLVGLRGGDVAYYRVYFIDFRGHYCAVRKIEAESDAVAVAEAELVRNGATVEVWDERKPIACLPPAQQSRRAR